MRPAVLMLIFFSIGLTFAIPLATIYSVSTYWLARALFLFSVAPGIYITFLDAKKSWNNYKDPNKNRFHAKRVSLSCCLFVPLLYSALLDSLGFPLYGIFVWDYLWFLIITLLLLPKYIAWSDSKLFIKEDEYVKLGRCIFKQDTFYWKSHKQLILSWIVKSMFIPIMYGGLIFTLSQFVLHTPTLNPNSMILWLFSYGLHEFNI